MKFDETSFSKVVQCFDRLNNHVSTLLNNHLPFQKAHESTEITRFLAVLQKGY